MRKKLKSYSVNTTKIDFEDICIEAGLLTRESIASAIKNSDYTVEGINDELSKIGENIIEAQKILGIDEGVEYTIDIFKIFDAGVMNNPGLIIDGKLICEGRVLSVDELVEIIKIVRKIGW